MAKYREVGEHIFRNMGIQQFCLPGIVRAIHSIVAGVVGGWSAGHTVMLACGDTDGGGMWPRTGCTKFVVKAFLTHMSIALASVAVNWLLCVLDYHNSGIGDENTV